MHLIFQVENFWKGAAQKIVRLWEGGCIKDFTAPAVGHLKLYAFANEDPQPPGQKVCLFPSPYSMMHFYDAQKNFELKK